MHFMYIRESKTRNKKTGKVYIKHSLVESIRTDRGPRQRVVLTLGELTVDREYWKDLALSLEACLTGTQELMYLSDFDLPENVLSEIARLKAVALHHQKRAETKPKEVASSDFQKVDVKSLKNTDSRSLGPELLAHQAWELLDFDKILEECGFTSKDRALAAAAVWGRLIRPGSDLSTWRWLREESSISEFFTADISRVHKDCVYEIADKLLAHKEFLEERLYKRQSDMFSVRETLFLFDLTNFYFEGCEKNNDLAARGKSKEKRQQNPLVSLALIVDQDGFPVKSKVYKGNISEPVTLEEILKECGLLDSESLFRPIIAMDRGIATKYNVSLLQQNNFPYAVVERADRRQEYAEDFLNLSGFDSIKDSKGQVIHVKMVENHVLCASEARKEKENAMAQRWIPKAEAEILKLQKAVRKGTFKSTEVIRKRLKTIKKRYLKFNDIFDAVYNEDAKELIYTMNPTTEDQSMLHGCYVIEFSKIEGDAEAIWRTYTTLTQVEAAFRSMKTDLGTRPVYHQGAERTESHLFLSILAYHMLSNIEHRLKKSNENIRWHSVRQQLATHQRSTILWKNSDGEIWHKRLSSSPETRHLQIYSLLQTTNPLADWTCKVKETKSSA